MKSVVTYYLSRLLVLTLVGAGLLFVTSRVAFTEQFTKIVIHRGNESGHQIEQNESSPQIQHIHRTESHNASYGNIASIFNERRTLLTRECLAHPYSVRYHGWYTLDEKRKLLLCPVAKIGSTFWRGIFYDLRRSPVRSNTPDSISYVSLDLQSPVKTTYEWNSVAQKYAQFSKILFVRDPYKRLYSTYVDKLVLLNYYYWSAYGKSIARNIRKPKDSNFLRCGHDATFSEFIKFVISEGRGAGSMDVHIVPVSRHCSPCVAKYDVIGKMETFAQDTTYIAKTYGMEYAVNITDRITRYSDRDMRDKLHNTVSWLYEKKFNTCISESVALNRMWMDLQIRGKVAPSVPPPPLSNVTRSGRLDVPLLIRETTRAVEISRAKSKERSDFKKSSYINAYKTVPLADKKKIAEIFYHDFVWFGYELYPKSLYPDNTT